LKKSHLILGLVVLVVLVAVVVWGHGRIHFDFAVFRSQLALADWHKIGIAVGCIFLGYVFRSVRWALLVRHNKKVSPLALLGTQVIGFTAVALIGRVADPVRPYLVAKKTHLPLSSQIAVYVVERMFDFGSMALIFSLVLLTTHEALPHPELLLKVAKGGLLATLALAAFTIGVRLAGGAVASFMEKSLGVLSSKLGTAVGEKIRTFRVGLDTMRSWADFGGATLLSLGMWIVITVAYLETTRAFVASPQLAAMTLSNCMLLMATSMAASAFQLPIIGWFTQIGLIAAAMSGFFSVLPEPATACSATLLLVTFLSIIPVGLIWARFEHVSLRKITAESEHAGEELADEQQAG
jgi:glycosyltransferase 2 family protein